MQEKTKKRGVLRRLFFNREDARAYGRFAFFFEGIMENVAMLPSSLRASWKTLPCCFRAACFTRRFCA